MASTLNNCLVTGGAGFIGCSLTRLLLGKYSRVVAFDNLHPQVHALQIRPANLDAGVEFVRGDVTNALDIDSVLAEYRPRDIVHLAAETGTGQSLTEATRHGVVNVVGTTTLLDGLVRNAVQPRRIVLSSSRAVYGEGQWRRKSGEIFSPGQRSLSQLQSQQWDFPDATFIPMLASHSAPDPISVYGATKLAQEHILAAWANSLNSDLSILRFQNVYGPGQSLTNSYTGIVVLFCRISRALKSIPLYEDGLMLRDFVHIDDVSNSIACALESQAAIGKAFDVGSGQATSIGEIAKAIASIYGAPAPHVSANFRFGDVRHACCEIAETQAALQWKPNVSLMDGLVQLTGWVDQQLSKLETV